MPGAPPTSPALFRVADTLELPSVECAAPATAAAGSGRHLRLVRAGAGGLTPRGQDRERGREGRPFGKMKDGTWHGGRLSANACHLYLLCHHPG
jgi:hypothetical protein